MDFRLNKKLIKKFSENKQSIFNDEKYFELKFRIQLIITTATIIMIIGGFIGFNSLKNIKDNLSTEINQYRLNFRIYDSTLLSYKKQIAKLDTKRLLIEEALTTSSGETDGLKIELIEIKKKYSQKIKTYIIKDIEFEREFVGEKTIYYRDIETIEGNELPKFSKPPILNILDYGLNEIHIVDNTIDYFKFMISGYFAIEFPEGSHHDNKFDLLITNY